MGAIFPIIPASAHGFLMSLTHEMKVQAAGPTISNETGFPVVGVVVGVGVVGVGRRTRTEEHPKKRKTKGLETSTVREMKCHKLFIHILCEGREGEA